MIFLLLILAIADPMSLQKGQVIPISIVLDDSLSMTAGGENSAQKHALKYLEKNILSSSLYRFTIILAGERPKIIGNWTSESKQPEHPIPEAMFIFFSFNNF